MPCQHCEAPIEGGDGFYDHPDGIACAGCNHRASILAYVALGIPRLHDVPDRVWYAMHVLDHGTAPAGRQIVTTDDDVPTGVPP